MVKNKHKKLWLGAAKMFNIIFLRTENNVVRAVFVLFLFLFHQPFLLFQHLFASFISGLRSFRFYARFGFTCCLATFVGFRWILRNLLGSCAVGFGHLDKKKVTKLFSNHDSLEQYFFEKKKSSFLKDYGKLITTSLFNTCWGLLHPFCLMVLNSANKEWMCSTWM